MAASRVGFQESFLLGGMLLWGCCIIVGLGTPAVRAKAASDARPGRTSLLEVSTVCLLVLAGSTQVFFLTAILPQVLPPLGIPLADTLEMGGIIIFVTGLAAAVGSLLAPRLGEIMGDLRAIVWFLGASSLLLALQALAPGCGPSASSGSSRCSASRRSSRSRWRPSPSARPAPPSASSTPRGSAPPSWGPSS